jgi:hypothetical protein
VFSPFGPAARSADLLRSAAQGLSAQSRSAASCRWTCSEQTERAEDCRAALSRQTLLLPYFFCRPCCTNRACTPMKEHNIISKRAVLKSLHPRECYTLHPTPYTLHPTPYTLRPTPYTLHPTPYTLPPYTLYPDPRTWNPVGASTNSSAGLPSPSPRGSSRSRRLHPHFPPPSLVALSCPPPSLVALSCPPPSLVALSCPTPLVLASEELSLVHAASTLPCPILRALI